MHPPLQIHMQGADKVFIDRLKIEPLRIKVTAGPAQQCAVLPMRRVQHSLKKVLVATRASDILRGPRASPFDASRHLRRGIKSHMLF